MTQYAVPPYILHCTVSAKKFSASISLAKDTVVKANCYRCSVPHVLLSATNKEMNIVHFNVAEAIVAIALRVRCECFIECMNVELG